MRKKNLAAVRSRGRSRERVDGPPDWGRACQANNPPDICRAIRANGFAGEALKHYYRTKPAQWAIYCRDKPGMEAAWRTL
jgi:hypothetical protein